MILTIAECAWCEEAARYLAATLRGVPCFTAEDYRREIEANPDCKLFRITREGGALVGFVVLRLERYAGGTEGVLLAAAGELAGARMYAQLLPVLERMFEGVIGYRADPCRRGAVRELLRAGYRVTHVTMRKPAEISPELRRERALEQLAELEAPLGGGDLRAGPGRSLHKGGGNSTSTNAQQTQNIDRRVATGDGGFALSADNLSNVTIAPTDLGAIKAAFDFAGANDQTTGKNLATELGFAKDVFTSGIGVLDAQSKLVAQAYDTAKGAGDQKAILTVAAIAAVAIVAVKAWGK